ncbi:patatin-like phospholipase family protein [Oleisolibacter albus]|uniref:patatin-like phospholipase family protein n=1 Tax=Oleisolibacter albus TaxID=2171757 RepID=UPI000DF25FC0|nr:patatin-like phospholipase family protein [Oleisolibacter albus]
MKIGLALGSGAARGWAHIGVIRALNEIGIRPDVVCGTSVGALVGGAWLTDQLDDLQDWAKRVGLMGVLKLIDITLSRGGLVSVEKAYEQFRNPRTDRAIEGLETPFAAVATDLATGREVWLREGHLLDVVRCSAAMPGLFPAVRHQDMWLVDGALVNPVPVSLCRAMGAEIVIAVNLNGDLSCLPRLSKAAPGPVNVSLEEPSDIGPEPPYHAVLPPSKPLAQFIAKLGATVGERTKFLASQLLAPKQPTPNVLEVLAGSIDIMQDRITRSRLAGEPPDVLLTPRIGHIGILDFDRAEELIELGYTATMAMRPAIDLAIHPRIY